MTFSFHCLVCDLAFELGMSEDEFYRKYDLDERSQLVATYRSKIDRANVMTIAPVPSDRGG